MQLLRFILFPFAILYGIPVAIRNFFYRKGIFKSSKFSIPIISVGNLSVGGTGKTPHVEYLIELLQDDFSVATLSRGFGRKERGFKIADEQTTYLQLGDEPMQYFKKYGDKIKVVAEANRVKGVMDLMHEHPETQVVLLDDAYQHQAIHRGLNILLTTENQPYFEDYLLPVGNLREGRWNSSRSDIFVVTKCSDLELVKKDYFKNKINSKNLFFSTIRYGDIHALNHQTTLELNEIKKVILVTGIADSEKLLTHLKSRHQILHHFDFRDHHNFTDSDVSKIHAIFDTFAQENPIILTTEKDAMRLHVEEMEKKTTNYPWYYQSIKVELDRPEEFNKLIKDYVEANI